jgi:hypothetical protein
MLPDGGEQDHIEREPDQDKRVHRLCRLMGLGLLLVDLKLGSVVVATEPSAYKPRANLPMQALAERAFRPQGRSDRGGSTRQPIMTAYRQRALACAGAMRSGPARPRDLKHLADDAGALLLCNVYRWFDRIKPGVYQLSAAGAAAAPEDLPREG